MTATQIHPLDLDPSLVDGQTYSSRRRRHLLDTTAVLCLTAALAMLIPSNLALPGLAGIGRPVIVFGMALAAGWAVAKFHRRLAVRGAQPLRWAAAIYLTAMLLSYANGFRRGLPPLEASAADRAMILSLVIVGVALVVADGMPNRTRLDNLLKVLVALGTVMAMIGHIQYVFGYNLVEVIQIPGLVDHQETVGFRDRGGGFFQIASTTAHYIEFSTVMVLLVPIAIHLARYAPTRLQRQLAGGCAIVIAAVVPMTLSRTGLVGLAIVLLVLGWFWSWRMRFNIAVICAGMGAALILVRPGMLGTLQGLFAYASDDPSVQGRTEDYGPAFAYVAQHPWFGRGHGTFIPSLYRFVDNDWLIHLITVGYLGTAAYMGWYLTAICLAVIAYRRAERAADRHLCVALIAAQVAAFVVAFFFDALAFTTHTTVLALLTGAAGAMWRFTHPSRQLRSALPRLGRDHWLRQPAAAR